MLFRSKFFEGDRVICSVALEFFFFFLWSEFKVSEIILILIGE